MDLQNLAILYEQFFLKVQYEIKFDNDIITIKGYPDNFIHLLGLQDVIPATINKKDFFYECLNGTYKKSLNNLIQKVKNSPQFNMISIKSCYFYNIQNTILTSKELYLKGDDFGFIICFNTSNGIQRWHTVICKYDRFLKHCVPKSNQVDKDKKYSNLMKYNYTVTPIISSQIIQN